MSSIYKNALIDLINYINQLASNAGNDRTKKERLEGFAKRMQEYKERTDEGHHIQPIILFIASNVVQFLENSKKDEAETFNNLLFVCSKLDEQNILRFYEEDIVYAYLAFLRGDINTGDKIIFKFSNMID